MSNSSGQTMTKQERYRLVDRLAYLAENEWDSGMYGPTKSVKREYREILEKLGIPKANKKRREERAKNNSSSTTKTGDEDES